MDRTRLVFGLKMLYTKLIACAMANRLNFTETDIDEKQKRNNLDRYLYKNQLF